LNSFYSYIYFHEAHSGSVSVSAGVFTYLSYRDPNLVKTLDNYDGTVQFLRELEMDNDALTKAIIGTIGDVDSYQLPDAKGYSRYALTAIPNGYLIHILFCPLNNHHFELPTHSRCLLLVYNYVLRVSVVYFSWANARSCSMMRYIMGITDEERQRRREEILSTRYYSSVVLFNIYF